MSEAHEPPVSEPVDGETVDLSDERYVKQRRRSARAHENTRAQVLRNLMGSIDGREWVFELLEQCHVYKTSFAYEPIAMAFMEGERQIGLHLIGQVQIACPDQYLVMMREAKDRNDVRD